MPLTKNATQYYYQREKIRNIMRNETSHTIFRHTSQPFATVMAGLDANLLAIDGNETVLSGTSDEQALAYTPYGDDREADPDVQPLGYNGEMRSDVEWYVLGNGYRLYSPGLMRFHLPDSESPFDRGGLNAYAYCLGDPVNLIDPSGHMPQRRLNSSSRPSSLRPSRSSSTAGGTPPPLPTRPNVQNNQTRGTNAFNSLWDYRDPRKVMLSRHPTLRTTAPDALTKTQKWLSTNTHDNAIILKLSPRPTSRKDSTSSHSSSGTLEYIRTQANKSSTWTGVSHYRNSQIMSNSAKAGLTLVAIAGTAGGVGYGLYKLVQALREDLS